MSKPDEGAEEPAVCHTANSIVAPSPSLPTLEEVRRKVIRELVDLEVVSARRLTRRERLARALRRRASGFVRW